MDIKLIKSKTNDDSELRHYEAVYDNNRELFAIWFNKAQARIFESEKDQIAKSHIETTISGREKYIAEHKGDAIIEEDLTEALYEAVANKDFDMINAIKAKREALNK